MALITNQITYLQLIDMFAQFATDHYMINSNGSGAISLLTESQDSGEWSYSARDFPMFWVVDGIPLVTFSDGQCSFEFQIVVADIAHDKDIKKNFRAQTVSDMIFLFQDFLAFLKVQPEILNNQVRIFHDGDSSGTSFEEDTDDNLTGLTFNLTIKQPIKYDYCAIPTA